jgi:hypothetical protein
MTIRMDRHGNVTRVKPEGRKSRQPWLRREVDRWRAGLMDDEGLAEALMSELGWKYDPGQPRVPAGQSGGGRWASGGAATQQRIRTCEEEDCTGAWGRDEFEAWDDQLTADERESVNHYTAHFYNDVNRHLRGHEVRRLTQEMISRTVKNVDSALAKSKTTMPAVSYRGVNCLSERCWDFFSGLEVGTTFQDDGYVSTTMNPNRFRGARVHMRIMIPEGVNAAYLDGLSQYEREAEVLLARGAKFKILNKRVLGDAHKSVEFEVMVVP